MHTYMERLTEGQKHKHTETELQTNKQMVRHKDIDTNTHGQTDKTQKIRNKYRQKDC